MRRRVLTQELSRRAACREYKLGWHTLKQVLAYKDATQPSERRRAPWDLTMRTANRLPESWTFSSAINVASSTRPCLASVPS